MEKVEELLNKLNSEQIKPVLDTEGAVLVIAGAGSGKTRVLTSRIAYLVLEKGVVPSRIMAITFTNKAANEMKERLTNFVGDLGDMWVSTIHSMCVKILRRDIDKIGYDTNFTIYDDTDKEKVLKRVLTNLNLEPDKFLKSAKNIISNAKNECWSPDEYEKENYEFYQAKQFANIYREYEKELMRSNSLDFDDLLVKTYELFTKNEEVADYYAHKFQYIHIDEFQDTNKVQFLIAKRLASFYKNIFAVGDDDQSIYGWRGAKIENILDFDKIYPTARVYKLEQNYRSTKKILALANCIIKNNTGRRSKELWTENGEGAKIETFVATDENNEAYFTATQIKGLVDRGAKYSDFAVFMRVNALSRAIEQEFLKYGIPYKIFGGFKFFERKEIKDVLAYLKIVNNYRDNESFLRAVSTPRRGIGDKTLSELLEYSTGLNLSLCDGISLIDGSTISSSAKTKLFNFKLLLDEFKAYSNDHTVAELIAHVLEKTSFNDQFAEKSEENTSKLYNINELINTAELFKKENPDSGLAEYLNSVTLSSDTDEINEGEAVTVATIHAVKGLEYKCVFVAGLDEKIMPIARTIGIDEDMEEERRLMYVAITRARERLFLIRARSRFLYGTRDTMAQSRFLLEGAEVLNPQSSKPKIDEYDDMFGSVGGYKRTVNYGADDDAFFNDTPSYSTGFNTAYTKNVISGAKPVENKGVQTNKYKSGIKVRHKKFGEGTVIAVKGEGENIVVDVAFVGIGIKQLAIKYAPMEII